MKIGITARIIYENGIRKQFVNEEYIKYVESAGFIPVILPISENAYELYSMCDAFLITGGEDIDSYWYNEEHHPMLGNFDLEMDKADKAVIEYAYNNSKPMLGICRGLQAINAFLGGTLIQHIDDDSHKRITYGVDFELVRNGNFFENVYSEHSKINSYHHQAIKKLAPDFKICGYSNGCIEAIEHESKPIIAVQWHPEKLDDLDNKNLIFEFKKLI